MEPNPTHRLSHRFPMQCNINSCTIPPLVVQLKYFKCKTSFYYVWKENLIYGNGTRGSECVGTDT
ncbi:hypothetical protein KIN20_023932 [Parelaphostrongylus tenuis]|uniref:Uncharacterized protein n=1 Tax=Parelaphostrongylus tenuis TaxID=148309 RepID=A0AAD5MSS2_PARTN|nr:hypothetical protein KIN20_023932 [Parelaphostrongylus tenuis]